MLRDSSWGAYRNLQLLWQAHAICGWYLACRLATSVVHASPDDYLDRFEEVFKQHDIVSATWLNTWTICTAIGICRSFNLWMINSTICTQYFTGTCLIGLEYIELLTIIRTWNVMEMVICVDTILKRNIVLMWDTHWHIATCICIIEVENHSIDFVSSSCLAGTVISIQCHELTCFVRQIGDYTHFSTFSLKVNYCPSVLDQILTGRITTYTLIQAPPRSKSVANKTTDVQSRLISNTSLIHYVPGGLGRSRLQSFVDKIDVLQDGRRGGGGVDVRQHGGFLQLPAKLIARRDCHVRMQKPSRPMSGLKSLKVICDIQD